MFSREKGIGRNNQVVNLDLGLGIDVK